MPAGPVTSGKMAGDEASRLCLHEIFERQARRTPDAPALVDPDTRLTYRELDRQSSLLAAYLKGLGVGPDRVAGIYMDRNAGFVVAVLGILKAGGAFLPLELAYPDSMLAEVVEDSEPAVVLTQERYAGRLPAGQQTFELEGDWTSRLADLPEPPDTGRPDPDSLVFVAYSSGTTGKPKGIANPHRAAVGSYLWRFTNVHNNRPGDRVGCNVFFIWEALRPLLRGATTVAIPDAVIYDPPALVRFLEEYGVTETLVTPSLLEAVLNNGGEELPERLSALKTLWLNGEVVTRGLAQRAAETLPHTRLLNVYSVSETHEVAAGDLRELPDEDSAYCPVGRPANPERVYILDEDRNPVPDGVPGELYVGGDWLAREYVGLPEKTAERFLEDPFAPEPGARMYRTGDRARLLPGGELEVLGRVDFMAKIRGYSVELGAVESALQENLAVHNCVAVAEGEEGADKRLVAYLVPADRAERGDRLASPEWQIDPAGRSPRIRRALQESLPHYMIPSVYVELDALPLQETTGKVDRKELPAPPARPEVSPSGAVELPAGAPRREREAALARIWEQVVGLEPGDVHPADDFFDVGGHSLAAAEMLSRVEDASGRRLSIPEFLARPTVEGLLDALEARERGDEYRPESPDLNSEAVLEPGIEPESAEPDLTLRDAGSVFLTGATGYLGAFILESLLAGTEATVHCLVRPRGADPMAPVRENMKSYGLWDPELAARVVPVPGDLSERRFGLGEEEFDALAREVEVVIHAAAQVNLVYPYAELKGTNVGGTREVLRLACRHRTKPVHYVSTNGIFPAGGRRWTEDTDLDALAGAREDGYGQTKWVAEKLVRQAAGRGLPVSVYRPGNISGHSASGASNPRDFLTALITESIRLRRAPEISGWRMEMTPVDFVSGAICHLAGDPAAAGGTFHLANPDPPPAGQVFSWIEDLGYPLETLEYPDWLRTWQERQRRGSQGDGVIGGVLNGAPAEPHELWDGNVYDDSNTRRHLHAGGPRRPQLNPDIFSNYVGYFREEGWVDEPESRA
jgi:amino acid adenylation domain-containing protein/thioester reductase-like protein